MRIVARTLLVYAAAFPMALAQSTDTAESATGSERARLANQRIQADLEMRAREEQRRLEEEQARLRAQEAAARSAAAASNAAAAEGPAPPATGAASGGDMSRTLEQIRTLGELKDAGYVTEEEFRKIKQRILDDRL